MSIVPTRDSRDLRVSCAIITVAAMCALIGSASDAGAQAQTPAQQSCLNALYKSAGKVGKTQGKVNTKCVKDRQAPKLENLGNPGQEQTIDACLTNDVKGSVAKQVRGRRESRDQQCTAEPPSFGAGTADQIAGAASSQIRQVVRDLFGPNFHSLTKSKAGYADKAGIECQPGTVQAAGRLYDALWKEMQSAAKGALSGKVVPAVTSGGRWKQRSPRRSAPTRKARSPRAPSR